MNIIDKITYILYGTYGVKRKLLNKNSNLEIDFVFPAKMVKSKTQISNHNKLNWILSKRTNLIKTNDHFKYDNVIINLNEINDIEIINVETWFGLIKYNVLKFNHNRAYFYFGLQSNDLQKYFKDAKYSLYKNYNYIFALILIIALLMNFLN